MEHSVEDLMHSCFWLPQKYKKRKDVSVILKPKNIAKELDLHLQYSSLSIHEESFDVQLLFTFSFIFITTLVLISLMLIMIWKIRKLSSSEKEPFQNQKYNELFHENFNPSNKKPIKQNSNLVVLNQRKRDSVNNFIHDLVEIQI